MTGELRTLADMQAEPGHGIGDQSAGVKLGNEGYPEPIQLPDLSETEITEALQPSTLSPSSRSRLERGLPLLYEGQTATQQVETLVEVMTGFNAEALTRRTLAALGITVEDLQARVEEVEQSLVFTPQDIVDEIGKQMREAVLAWLQKQGELTQADNTHTGPVAEPNLKRPI